MQATMTKSAKAAKDAPKSPAELERIIRQHELFLARRGGQRADLTLQNMCGVSLPGVNLTDAKLTGTNFEGAKLQRAVFDRCDMFGANLAYADLTEASFVDTDLRGVTLRGAILHRAQMPNVDLRSGQLLSGGKGSDELKFARTEMGKVDLSGAAMAGANLSQIGRAHV